MPYEYVAGMPDLEVIAAATAQVDRWRAMALDRHRLCYLPEVVRRDIIETRGRGFCATKVPTRHTDRPATLRVVPCGGDGCADRCAEEQTRDLIARVSATWGNRTVRRLEFDDEEMRDRWYASCGLRKRHPGAVSVPVTHGRRVDFVPTAVAGGFGLSSEALGLALVEALGAEKTSYPGSGSPRQPDPDAIVLPTAFTVEAIRTCAEDAGFRWQRHGRGWVSEAPVDLVTWDLFRRLLDDARHLFNHEAA